MDRTEYTLEFEKPLRELEKQLLALRTQAAQQQVDLSGPMEAIQRELETTQRSIYANLTAWQRVQLARHPKRPNALDYIKLLFVDFQELHGDRAFGDDQALIGGPAFFEGESVMVVAEVKGRDTKENLARNFGMPHPEGYRKAGRLMQMAARFGRPIVSFIDTPGAFPGLGGEERHVAEAIAVNLREMALLPVPSISIIVGEGGSGGALGIGVTDRIVIFENAYYSVISPEGCAAILWKDRVHAPKAAEALKLGARELLKQGIVDDIIAEPVGGAHRNPAEAANALRATLARHLGELRATPNELLLEQRYAKFRKMGVFAEATVA